MSLTGRVVVITGATGGLGRVAARAFAEHGAALALLSATPEKLAALAAELQLPPERLLTHAADLREPAAVHLAAQAVADQFGRAAIVAHLVGGYAGGQTLWETPAADFQTMLDQHLWSTVNILQAFGPQLVANGWGRVIVVSSPLAMRPTAKSAPYAAAKSAQEALLLTFAQEVKDKGVTANILQVRTIDVDHQRAKDPTPARAAWSTPEEIVAAMLYLCSAEAQLVNGARLPLFGSGA